MPAPHDPHARDLKRAGTLVDRLELMFDWYKGMVDQHTGRLLYLYHPQNDLVIGDGEPIRDIAAVWDVEVLSAFLERDDLSELIRRSLAHFDQWGHWARWIRDRGAEKRGLVRNSLLRRLGGVQRSLHDGDRVAALRAAAAAGMQHG